MAYGPIISHRQMPTEIRQLSTERKVVIQWPSGNTSQSIDYPMEYLRIACPCAECRGHTPSQRQLIDGKQDVVVTVITMVGHYAIKIAFSDGHDSGVYTWDNLYNLGISYDRYWSEYLQELQQAGKRRRPSVFMIKPISA